MAPARTPRGYKREADYSNIGVAGRKTGITLKDTGIRDEHGLEPLDGIFSSPEKPPAIINGNGHNSTITEEEDMEIGDSTVPEPTEVLTNRKSRTLLRPPVARSPIKTSLGSSPRRSVGPMSSPQRNSATPSRAMSHPLVNRRLDFSMEEPRQSIERSPQKAHSVTSSSSVARKGKLLQSTTKGRKRPFDLSAISDEEEEEISTTVVEPTNFANGMEGDGELNELGDVSAPIQMDGDSIHLYGDTSLQITDDTPQEDESVHTQLQAQPNQKRKRAGRPRKVDMSEVDIEKEKPVADDRSILANPPIVKRRAGRPSRKQVPQVDESLVADVEEEDVRPAKRGRKPLAKPETAHDVDQENGVEPSKPATRARRESRQATPTKAGSKLKKSLPSERDPNIPIRTGKMTGKASSIEPSSISAGYGKPSQRSLYVLRHETPAEDDGSRLLRSGRTSVKPIAFWRGERIVYGESNIEGKNLSLPAIKEVIRTEEVFEPRPRRPGRRGAKPPGRQPLYSVEEEDEEQEEWEQDPGVLRAEVMQWDPTTQRGIEENIEDVELALAPAALQALSREVKGAEFTFAKTLTLPFFHSGMVDLPPGGVKRIKNSRKNHMVFWIFYGRVKVEVAGAEFSIGRGGMWQVPRGNFYGISNESTKAARIFFAQGCYMNDDSGEPVEESTE